MKYKAAGLLACFAALLTAFAATCFLQTDNRVHQHLEEGYEKEPTEKSTGGFSTHLPLVEIDTYGQEIPGKPIFSENGSVTRYTMASDGTDCVAGWMKIQDEEGKLHRVGDVPSVESAIEIHIRGNSSRWFDKSSYAIKLIDEKGENNPKKIMGMDEHHEWALYGPFLDKTLMRNYMWYNISGEIMDYAPNVRFCEVMLNGEYMGVYVMMETITAGSNGSRLKISVNKKQNSFSGYILRLDRGSNVSIKNLNSFLLYTRRTKHKMNIVYPGSANLTEEMARDIKDDFSLFEKTLYSYDYDDKDYGYETLIDVDSFINYFLVNEFTCNYDAGRFSTYIYKGIDGKYRMCVWDFNNACDNYQETAVETEGFQLQNSLWYFMLTKDEDFTERLIERYRELRKTYFSEKYLYDYIDGVTEFLGEAVERNYEKWGYSFEESYDLLMPRERNVRSYEESIQQLKDFLKERGEWLDDNIETLRQYSAESKVKKFNENAN